MKKRTLGPVFFYACPCRKCRYKMAAWDRVAIFATNTPATLIKTEICKYLLSYSSNQLTDERDGG